MMAAVIHGALPMLSQSLYFSQSDVVWKPVSNPSSSVSFTLVSLTHPLIYCGCGDKKTAKGKRFKHSFGNARSRDKKKGRGPPRPPMPPPSPSKKDRFDDDC